MGSGQNHIYLKIYPKVLWVVTFTFTSLYSYAAIPPQQLTIDFQSINPVKEKAKITRDDVAAVIPMNLQPGQSQAEVGLRVVDHTLNRFTQGDYFRNTEFGKAATGVEKAMTTEVHFGNLEENEIQHSINMQIQAFEQKAYLKYSGFTYIRVTYLMYNSDLNLELSEKLGSSTELIVTHTMLDQLSKAQLRWSW